MSERKRANAWGLLKKEIGDMNIKVNMRKWILLDYERRSILDADMYLLMCGRKEHTIKQMFSNVVILTSFIIF